MSLADLQSQLQTLANAGTPLPIGETAIRQAGLTPRAGLDDLLRSRLGLTADLPVTFSGTLAPPAGDTLAFSGTASVLGAPGATAAVAFIQSDGTVDVRVGIEPAAAWHLGAAFPILGGQPFDELALGTAAYVVTSCPQGDSFAWNGAAQPLTQGANLFAILTLDGPLAAVADLLNGALPTDQVVLSGTVDPSDPDGKAGPVPALALSAPVGKPVGIPDLALGAPRVEVRSAPGSDGQRLAWLVLATTFMPNAQPLFDLEAMLSGNGGMVTFALVPPPGRKAITPDQIAAVIGGVDYRKLVPPGSELQTIFDAAGVRGLGVVVDVKSLSVLAATAEIGSNGPWGPWGPPDVAATLEDLALTLTVADPFAGGTPDFAFGFDASASILPKIFQGDFDVAMSYDLDSSDLVVAASFPGTLSINALIGGISGGAVDIPDDWVNMSFRNFGLTFSKPGASDAQYTLYGVLDVGFQLPFLGVHVDTELQALVDSALETYKVAGTLTLSSGARGWVFDGEAALVKGETTLKAGWQAMTAADRLGIGTIVSAIGLTPPAIPDGLDLDLQSAGMTYLVTAKVLVLEVDSASYGKGVFASAVRDSSTKYFGGLKVERKIELVDIPLLKSVLGGSSQLAVEGIQVLVSSPLTADDAKALVEHIDTGYPQPPTSGMDGLALSMQLDLGTYQVPLSLVLGAGGTTTPTLPAGAGAPAPPGTPPPAANAAPPAPTDGTVWVNLQKSFGPVAFQKVGIRYSDSVLWFLMNASLSVGGLTISVFGLGAGSKLNTFEPRFTIDGLGVTLSEGPVELSGALLGTLDPLNFYGELLVSVDPIKVGALGGYAEVDGHPSFFGYVVVDVPLGGPPFFFVTGLAGGIGFNRQLTIPRVDGVADFPFVSWATGSGNPPSSAPGADPSAQVSQVVQRLSQVVTPAVGEYWLAAGVQFTTFKVLDCFALVVVKLGTEFEVALLGLATAQIPPAPSPAVAKAQLALEATFAPSTGLIAIGGQLTPASYVLAPECHLTGGFAFWSWVSGLHEGELVVTLGGYSPKFTPPDYYPQVPRLGLSWNMGDLTIQGGLYFALTSSAVMAGGSLSATWQSGDIRAWFTVWADFLIVFEPFHYYISAGIQLGASFSINLLFTRVTISIHLGVEIEIWGPQFTGRATIDLSLISFTIGFGGSGESTATTIEWGDFVARLLPHDRPAQKGVAAADTEPTPAIVQIQVAGGMLKQLDGSDGIDFIADGERLSLVTKSTIPAKTFTGSSNLALTQPDGEWAVGIGPTGVAPAAFSPTHDVQITTLNTDRRFVGTPATGNVAKALWEQRQFDEHGIAQGVDPVHDTTVPGVATGLKIDPHAPEPDVTLPIPLEQLLYTEDENIQAFAWSGSSGPETDPFTDQTVWGTITQPLAAGNRSLLVAELVAEGMAVPAPAQIDVGELASEATFDLLEPPALRLLGEQR